ncbi:hypothetical protein Sa4125_21900 [Aureimonas sp. SA4125]|nr:hypothetical protein Sa4125_21900 [Aureimonas sp. SA4125]
MAAIGSAPAAEMAKSGPIRMVVSRYPEPKRFAGITLENLSVIVFANDCNACADRFRKDVIVVWSTAAGSKWTILPPRRIGAAAEPQ